jgi:Flp pilus assembly protein TadG
MRRIVRRLSKDTGAAIAPTVALTLFALIAAGGIAFDYARVASMDSELQNAADQAALAAASQLDGQPSACARAAAAANALLTNNTLMANEPGNVGMQVVIPTGGVTDCTGNANIQFYQSYNQTTDTPGPAATADTNARIVQVSVTPRESFFTLTPVVAAFRSGTIGAQAVASLGSAVCRVPPLMMCNPDETNDPSFTVSNYLTKGLKLVQGGSGAWAPGNFGFLDHLGGSNGNTGLREDLGWNVPPGECQPGDGVDTKPGVNAVNDALNSRFDIYDTQACIGTGFCPPSVNVVKDLVRDPAANGGNSCRIHNQGWHEVASGQYLPTSPTTALATSITPTAMGHPRDMCHAVSAAGAAPCSGPLLRIGDGNWDRDAYFRANYVRTAVGNGGQPIGSSWTAGEWQANTLLSPTAAVTASNYASRWNVYNWEIANRGNMVDGVRVLGQRIAASPDAAEGSPVCSAGQGFGTGAVPSSTQVDRRKLVIAVVNCTAQSVNGNSVDVQVQKWIDSFLVEPSYNRASGRTDQKEVYVEVIGETLAGGSNGAPIIRRDVPYLLK